MSSRTHTLTAIAPLAPGRFWWSRLVLPVLRMLARSTSLARLRFIHFAGWIVYRDLPSRRADGAADRRGSGWRPRPTMLFLSDFDGDPSEYLAAFGITVASGVRWSFGSAAGFPGPRPTRQLVAYVRQHSADEQLRYRAYPGATVRDVDQAAEVTRRLAALQRAVSRDGADQPRAEARHYDLLGALARAPQPPQPSFLAGLWSCLRARSTVGGLVVVTPIAPGSREDVVSGVRKLHREPEVFDRIGRVHFARMAVLRLPGRARRADGPPPDHLLFSAWHDGGCDDFVERLVDGLGSQADVVWGGTPGYPGSEDPDRLASWILDHRLRFSLFLGSRSGWSVEDVRAALTCHQRVLDVVTASAGQPALQVRRELARLHC